MHHIHSRRVKVTGQRQKSQMVRSEVSSGYNFKTIRWILMERGTHIYCDKLESHASHLQSLQSLFFSILRHCSLLEKVCKPIN